MNKNVSIHFIQTTRSLTYFRSAIAASFILLSCTLMGQDKQSSNGSSDNILLDQLIQSKGTTISFDASNIKQYWTDLSVVSIDNSIKVLMNHNNNTFESIPLKIQLANVNEAMDCRIDVFFNNSSSSFYVLDDKGNTISSSQRENNFLDYYVSSSTFHLEDTLDYTFFLRFNSTSPSDISIKKIVLSFSKNEFSNYLASPGKIIFSKNGFSTNSSASISDDNFVSVTGKLNVVSYTKKILVTDNELRSTLTVKNTGKADASVRFGYTPFTKDNVKLDPRNFPYKDNNKILTVISSFPQSNKVVVDTITEWSRGCFLALDAREDMSDIPNNSFTEGKILEIKEMDDGHAEITLDKPITTPLKVGSKVRIHGKNGALIYTNSKVLHPGEEESFTATIKKDDSFLKFSREAFPRNTHYVIPAILSLSDDSNTENTIQIIESSVSY